MPFVYRYILCLLFFSSTSWYTGKRITIVADSKIVFTSIENSRVSKDSMYYYRFAAMDSLKRKLTLGATHLPAWLSFNKNDNSISGKATTTGQYPVHLFAASGTDTIWQQYMLTVYDNKTVNILCLGNSITNGTDKYNSYRRDLWQLLHAGSYNFDFIGSWSKHHMGGEVPQPDFDMDHEGHSGWTFQHMFTPPDWDSVRGNIYKWLKVYTPDIVLLELGTNDVFQCRSVPDMISDLSRLVDVLRSKNPAVKIFTAQIPPLGARWADKKLCGTATDYAHSINELNKAIAAFVQQRTTAASPVILVDQFTGVDTATDMYDDIHPNDKGEKIMAQKWFAAIKPYLEK